MGHKAVSISHSLSPSLSPLCLFLISRSSLIPLSFSSLSLPPLSLSLAHTHTLSLSLSLALALALALALCHSLSVSGHRWPWPWPRIGSSRTSPNRTTHKSIKFWSSRRIRVPTVIIVKNCKLFIREGMEPMAGSSGFERLEHK